jgi:hypothetical protein
MKGLRIATAMLMVALLLGMAISVKALDLNPNTWFDHHDRDDYTYRNNDYRDFSRWDAYERERLRDAYRRHEISRDELVRLRDELNNVRSFYNDSTHDGRLGPREGQRLEDMQARVSSDIDREINEHRYHR